MEKNATGSRTFHQRLLSTSLLCRLSRLIPGQSARRCAVVVLCCCAALLYSQDSGNAIELRLNNDTFFIHQDFEVDIVIRHDAPAFRRNRDMPSFMLEGHSAAVELLQSSTMPEQDGLHIRSRYRFTQTGTYTFIPVLQWKRMRLELAPLHLTVHEPLLSENTAFLWKLYTPTGELLSEESEAEQGQPYLLCLTASFYAPGYDAQYQAYFRRAAVPTDSSGAAQHAAPAALPLPAGILRIDCPATENAAIEQLGAVQLPAALIKAENAKKIPQPYILAVFEWIPLSTGLQALPQASVSLGTGTKTVSTPRSWQVLPWGTSAAQRYGETPQEIGSTDHLPDAAFTEAVPEAAKRGAPTSVQEEISAARKIAALRYREKTAVFPFTARHERKKLEAALGIVQPLPLYPAIGGIFAAIFAVLLAACSVWLKLRNKKNRILPVLILALCCAAAAVGLLSRTLKPQGVCIVPNHETAIRRIPEAAGSVVYRLALGESVWIVRQTALWFYVTTAGGISGWVPHYTLASVGGNIQ